MEEAFTEIYEKNIWGGGSGSGSNMTRNNQKYIDILHGIIKDNELKTICDVGCGDWEFSHNIDFGDASYIGIDCVKSVISENQRKYGSSKITFQKNLVGPDYIPEGYDLVILKDVIQHWTDEDIMKYLPMILDRNAYVFLTNGFKFMRDPKKNSLPKRDISNRYRYHPVDIAKYPLSEFKDHLISTQTYFSKQMNVLRKT
jgi:2-polyprenyl-3-methyl-5-hydroxy-6-metoxy-1,4-benzoquinol methylase